MTRLQEVLQSFRQNERIDVLKKIEEITSGAGKISIVNLVVGEEKITAQLNDGRELSIPIDWFAKWGIENATTDKLKKYEIWEGEEIYFPDLDEVLGIEKFTDGFDAPCE
ncbi:DUF2442 domain-containing protein [endosymbiont GvMRE of Glomus versiforme]|uniref:DUF2442 domain-containing protein n=1 Tax=endosymbiont GvMRE of Glomus versiforme TaxID=2039283 RepID=UPI000EE1A81F|nr:DUF2442 domain-containing protein [endosymbiont GvMRE of Glomus versiforme]RHZ35924.1 Conserved protein of unkwnown function (DUF2442 domain) [endosymbiont GvMRE of Glomus versiforme]